MRRRLIGLGFLCLPILAVPQAEAKGRTETFKAPRESVWAVALAFISENYTVNTVSQAEGMISFRGGAQDASGLIVAKSETETNVTVNSKAGHAGLSWGLGIDSKKLQGKVLNGIAKGLLHTDPPKEATSVAPVAATPGGTAPTSGSAEGRGVFRIESTPPGAEVYVDGEFVGTTPIAEQYITVGRHDVELRKKGLAPWKRQLNVSAGAQATVAVEMEP